VFADKVPVNFDATFATEECGLSKEVMTGEVKYQNAPVITPPPGVASLSAARTGDQLRLAWKNPRVGRYRYTVVRVEPAEAVSFGPTAGLAAYAGPGNRAVISGLAPGRGYRVAVFTVDQYGNVSAPAVLRVTG
jgi:hypothetical protein